jgi:PAS domain S-box-containing protein
MPHDVLVTTRPLRNDSGEIIAVMKALADISSEKELAGRLRNSLSLFHNLFDHAPCFITVQNQEMRILEANQRFQESFGEGAGRPCYELYKKRSEPCTVCVVAETFADGKEHTSEEMLVDNQGREVHVLVYTAPMRDVTGKITSVMEMATDVTEIRTLQNKLADLGQLVGGIAHNAKNILEGLRGGIYVANLGFRDNNQEDIRTGWDMVQRNVGRLSAVILDMLYCARERSPRRLPLSLPKLIKEVAALFISRAAEYRITLEVKADDPLEILGEPKDIHSMLSNLITNAIDACNEDQNEQKPHRVTVRAYPDQNDIVLAVEDNGAGMNSATRDALFKGMISTKGNSGTGLGLLMSQKVAVEHGGSITVASELGKGSTFTVRLPVRQPNASST